MNIIKFIKYFHIDSVFYFLSLTSLFLGVALRETSSGNFLVTPLFFTALISVSFLSTVHCCESDPSCNDVYVEQQDFV